MIEQRLEFRDVDRVRRRRKNLHGIKAERRRGLDSLGQFVVENKGTAPSLRGDGNGDGAFHSVKGFCFWFLVSGSSTGSIPVAENRKLETRNQKQRRQPIKSGRRCRA